MSTIDLTGLEIFFGDANAAETRVYARLGSDALPHGVKLTGAVTGPFCQYAQTLPATIPLVDQGPGAARLAQSIVPDPCFWSPEMPYLYNIRVEVRRGSELVEQTDRTLGIRPLGARGRRLVFEGKNWVLRGVRQQAAPQAVLDDWREAAAALVAETPSDELCQQASRIGVLVAAQLDGEPQTIEAQLRRLSRWAAVGLAIVDTASSPSTQLRAAARNVVLVQRRNDLEEPIAPWAHAALIPADKAITAESSEASVPLLVERPAQEGSTVGELRRACDRLQRDLAGRGNFAGYVV